MACCDTLLKILMLVRVAITTVLKKFAKFNCMILQQISLTVLISIIFKINNPCRNKTTFVGYQPGYRYPIYRVEESPDSKGQHTG